MRVIGDVRALMDGSGVIDLLPIGACVCVASGELLYYNASAAELWGRQPERFDPLERFTGAVKLLHRDGTVMRPEETPTAMALRSGETHDVLETILERPDGQRLRLHSRVGVLCDDRGAPIAAIEVFHERAAVRVDLLKRSADDLAQAVREIGEQTLELRARTRELRATIESLFDLAAVARDVAGRFANRARATEASIRVYAGDPVHVLADRHRIDEMLTHVVDNALRHGGGDVDVRVRRSDKIAELSVGNAGPGATFTVSLPLAPP